MPRLTAKDYLRAHDQLRRLWLQDASLFAELTPTEQWQLQDFFKPGKDWSDLALLQHRETVTAQHPSLPHQAGRTLNRFWETTVHVGMKRVMQAKMSARTTRLKQTDRHLVVKPLAHPELNPHKLARAYINLAYVMAKKRAAENSQDGAEHSNS